MNGAEFRMNRATYAGCEPEVTNKSQSDAGYKSLSFQHTFSITPVKPYQSNQIELLIRCFVVENHYFRLKKTLTVKPKPPTCLLDAVRQACLPEQTGRNRAESDK